MAEVYAATHTLTEHAVAIKVLRPTPGAPERTAVDFSVEAKIDARVGSEHIVGVRDAGVDEATGSPYLVMELLHGKTFARLLQEAPEGRLRVDRTLEILRQVARGLDAAHAYSVVHRDLKPENVFVTESSVAKILDFGIAKLLDVSNHTTEEVRGTPHYMAAEQANGERVSPQTDIWALGLMAHRALTGRIYWRCANEPRGKPVTFAKIIQEITSDAREPPSSRLARLGWSIGLPDGFDAWFLRCIDPEPERRFPSAGAAVQALALVLADAGPEILGSPIGTSAELNMTTSRTRTYGSAAAPCDGSLEAPLGALRAPSGPGQRRFWKRASLGIAALAMTLLLVLSKRKEPSAAPEAIVSAATTPLLSQPTLDGSRREHAQEPAPAPDSLQLVPTSPDERQPSAPQTARAPLAPARPHSSEPRSQLPARPQAKRAGATSERPIPLEDPAPAPTPAAAPQRDPIDVYHLSPMQMARLRSPRPSAAPPVPSTRADGSPESNGSGPSPASHAVE
jgi:serine/threonine-protein kinase